MNSHTYNEYIHTRVFYILLELTEGYIIPRNLWKSLQEIRNLARISQKFLLKTINFVR